MEQHPGTYETRWVSPLDAFMSCMVHLITWLCAPLLSSVYSVRMKGVGAALPPLADARAPLITAEEYHFPQSSSRAVVALSLFSPLKAWGAEGLQRRPL